MFAIDFNNLGPAEAPEVLAYTAAEFAPGLDAETFMQDLLDGLLKKRSVIDEVITKAAPEWPLEKINAVDRNILRLGLYELLFGDYEQVPPKVAINEAIELAKSFGGESSGRFVNGVLGAVYKEIGEPGKAQQSKHAKEVAYEDMPVDLKAGAVVYSRDEQDNLYFAMVHDVFGFWTLSKGGVEEGETPEQAVIREVREEIGIDIVIESKFGENEYIANHPERGKVRKQVSYFLGRGEYTPLTLEADSGGLDDAQWFPVEEVPSLRMYEDVTGFMTQAIEHLLGVEGSDSVESGAEEGE